ncbi:MAG TPA: hypothetical protein VHB21_11885, partial [Minicystis sp.]|nr:hypothetical protein [Minicystis sp.]
LGASLELYDQLGDRRRWTEVVCGLSTMAHYLGRFEERVGMGAQVWERGKDGRDVQAQAWGLLDQAETLVRMGRFDHALALLEKAIGYEALGLPPVDRLWAHGLLAATCLSLGDVQRARREADETLDLTNVVPPNMFYVMEGYAGATETFLALWEAQRGARGALDLRAKSRAMLRQMLVLSISVLAGRPRRSLCAGVAAWLDGRPRAAHRAWKSALSSAERLGMPYEEARAHAEIALHLPAGDAARRVHFERARASFERVGAAWDLRRLSAARSGS